MSLAAIRELFKQRLDGTSPPLLTFYDGEEGAPPADGESPWQRATLVPARTVAAGFGKDAGARWSGYYQVTPFYPTTRGAGVIDARVDALLARFSRGTSLTVGAAKVTLLQPYIGQTIAENGWMSCPVYAPFFAYLD